MKSLTEALSRVKTHATGGRHLLELPLTVLEEDPENVRKSMDPDALAELAASLRTHGSYLPLIVLALPGGRYRVLDGNRRLRAAQLAELPALPAIPVEKPEDKSLVQLMLNLQREDVSGLETAEALRALLDSSNAPGRTKLTQVSLGQQLGKSQTWVQRHLALLDLPDSVRDLAETGRVTSYTRLGQLGSMDEKLRDAVVTKLKSGSGYEDALLTALNEASDPRPGATPAALGSSDKKSPASAPLTVQTSKDPDVVSLETRLAEILGSPVKIAHKPTGKGRVTIDYANLEVLQGIVELIESRKD